MRISRSMCWSLLALGLTLVNYIMHRDISSNVFFAAFMLIQALKSPTEDGVVLGRVMTFVAAAGTALLTFGAFSRMAGLEWGHPAAW